MKELYSEWYEIFFENFRNGISGIKKLINKKAIFIKGDITDKKN